MVEERLPDELVYRFRYEDGPDGRRRSVETGGKLPGRDVLAELSGAPENGAGEIAGAKGIFHMHLAFGPKPFSSQ